MGGKPNCLRLWKIWNFIFLSALYIYLIYDCIYRYIKFKKYSLDLGFGSNYSAVHMNVYLICIIAGLTCFPFSLYCILFFNGNYADDNIKVGKDTDNFKIHQENDVTWQPDELSNSEKSKNVLWKRLKRHFLPYSFIMHFVSAICFLVPLPFLEAHQIRQKVLKPKKVLNSDDDDVVFLGQTDAPNKIFDEIWHSDLDFLWDIDSWHLDFTNNERWRTTWLMKPQYFNLIFCLLCLILKYPNVFWACHKGFSFTFSFLLTLISLHVIIDYSTTCVLIRVASNPEFVGEKLKITFLSPICLMLLSILGSSVLLLTFWCVFEFGFHQFLDNLSRYRHLMLMQCDGSHDGSNMSDITCCKRKDLYLRGYLPHFGAMFGCAIGFSMKTPLFYASISVIYHHTSDPLMFLNLLLAIVFICVWFIAWFGFTLKPNWRFILPSCTKAISDISSTTIANSMTTGVPGQSMHSRDLGRGDQANQVYSCYHGMKSRLVMDERLRNPDCYSEENDLPNNPASNNYVYLQSTMNPAINHILMSNNMPQLQPGESPLMVSFHDNIDSRNTISESESSYDSASNIRNQVLISVDPYHGRFQSLNSRTAGGVLKYSDSTARSFLPDYIPLQSENICGTISKLDTGSSGDTSTLLAGESETTLKSVVDTKQQIHQSVSLNRQNSSKKRIYGQRVTFKDEQPTDMVDCSPNNSEQSSNNTASSDSGIDSNSKQPRNMLPQMNLADLNSVSAVKRSGVNIYDNSMKFIPPSNQLISTNGNSFFGYCDSLENPDSKSTLMYSHSQNPSMANELLATGNERQALSYLSESDQEQRLCSQV